MMDQWVNQYIFAALLLPIAPFSYLSVENNLDILLYKVKINVQKQELGLNVRI